MTQYIEHNNRQEFLSLMPKNSICAELGVHTGKFSSYIIKETFPKKLYLVDPYWKKYGDVFPWGKHESTWDTFCKAVKRMTKYDINKCSTFIIDEDINFLEGVKDRYFDWVYLDSSHLYEDSLKELRIIRDKVKKDGLICGHDYRENPRHKHHGVCKAINEWLEENKEYELYLKNNHTQWIIKRKK
jgi:hypothetical protein